jgi:hypothetical protein
MHFDTLIHADIFFFISTIALVVIAIGMCIALFYVIGILRNTRDISESVKEESKEFVHDIHALRNGVKKKNKKTQRRS